MFVVCCRLPVGWRLFGLVVVCGLLLFVACCGLKRTVYCCLLHLGMSVIKGVLLVAVGCSLLVVCGVLLCVVCCLLCVARCGLSVAWLFCWLLVVVVW